MLGKMPYVSQDEEKWHNLEGFEVQSDSLWRNVCWVGGVMSLQEITTERGKKTKHLFLEDNTSDGSKS